MHLYVGVNKFALNVNSSLLHICFQSQIKQISQIHNYKIDKHFRSLCTLLEIIFYKMQSHLT